jgi:hypothetical protein
MIQADLIDPDDTGYCINLNQLPKVSISTNEAYSVGIGRTKTIQDLRKERDMKVRSLVELLNSKSVIGNGKPVVLKTKGFSDGIVNVHSDYDDNIAKKITNDKGVVDEDSLNKYMAGDPDGFKAVSKLMKGSAGYKSFKDYKSNDLVMSMLRNYYLAAFVRGQEMCKNVFDSADKCINEGTISALLENGEHNKGKGCCDGRRGSIIEIDGSAKENKRGTGTGQFQPKLSRPSPDLQQGMQTAASLSVFGMLANTDKSFDQKVLNHDYSDQEVEADRERFANALEKSGSNCKTDRTTVEAMRRIYYYFQQNKAALSPDFRRAVEQNDYEMLRQLISKNSNLNGADIAMYAQLQEGMGHVETNYLESCPGLQNVFMELDRKDKKAFRKCNILPTGDAAEFFNQANIKTGEDLVKWIEKNGGTDVGVVGHKQRMGEFYLVDSKNRKSYTFSYDYGGEENPGGNKECETALSSYQPKIIKAGWNKTSGEKPGLNCMIQRFKKAPQLTKIGAADKGVYPTDIFNCLDSSKAINYDNKNNPSDASLYQKPFCHVSKNNEVSFSLNKDTLAWAQHDGDAPVQGFICTGCGSGVWIQNNQFVSKARFGGNGNWSLGNGGSNGVTMASLKHPSSYIIPNCGDSCSDSCSCMGKKDINELMKTAERIDYSSNAFGQQKNMKYKGDSEDDKAQSGSGYACIYTPPIPHTCSFRPTGDHGAAEKSDEATKATCPLKDELIKRIGNKKRDVAALAEKYKQGCQSQVFPVPESSCKANPGNICCRDYGICNSSKGGKSSSGSKQQ